MAGGDEVRVKRDRRDNCWAGVVAAEIGAGIRAWLWRFATWLRKLARAVDHLAPVKTTEDVKYVGDYPASYNIDRDLLRRFEKTKAEYERKIHEDPDPK